MNRRRAVLVALAGLVALALLATPAAAGSHFDSVTEELIQELNVTLLYAALPITVLVEGILIYTVWRFRTNDEPSPTKENRRLEITWTIATAIVLLFVGVASYQVLASPYVAAHSGAHPDAQPDGDAVEVTVVAQKWFWTFEYPEHNVTSSDTLVLPVGRDVYLNVTSKDWIHSVHVPELGLKQDAVPGEYNTIRTRLRTEGEYQLYCAEYCGAGHSEMLATVEVVSQEEYRQWLDEQKGGQTQGGNASNATGGG